MTHMPTAARRSFGDIAPALEIYTDEVLYGRAVERPDLSKRDRSLMTVPRVVGSIEPTSDCSP